MKRPKSITLLAPDLSSNSLGRVYILARVLQRNHEVEVLGPAFGDGIWPPVDDGSVPIRMFRGENFPAFSRTITDISNAIRGDIVYAAKPRLTSFGIGLRHARANNKPLLLDIDDLDIHGDRHLHPVRRYLGYLYRIRNPYNNLYIHFTERLAARADAITVVSSALQKRYGGTLLPHGRDTTALDPDKFDREAHRREFGLSPADFVLMFFGTPRPHKGLETVLDALRLLPDPQLQFWIVGAADGDPYIEALKARGDQRLRVFGRQPWARVGPFLSLADAVVLPQLAGSFSAAQTPAKVFDAMAMAKPILAGRTGDLPHILDGCGFLFEPGNAAGLAECITEARQNPHKSGQYATRAREKSLSRYSWDVMERTLETILEKF